MLTTMTTMSLAAAEAHLSEVVARVSSRHERVTVTVHGTASAVLLAPEDLEAVEETIAVLGDGALVDQLREPEADIAAGRVDSRADLDEAMARRRARAS